MSTSKLRFKISMSLDGFVAGLNQSVKDPIGVGGMRLHGPYPPFHHPVFVLTHHAREPLELQGGTTFTFVTGGIEAADVSLAGGASVARQYLAAVLVDEMEINLVPVILGAGERLFDGLGGDLRGLELVRTVAAPNVTHLKFARR